MSGTLHLAYSLSLQRGYQVADLSVVFPSLLKPEAMIGVRWGLLVGLLIVSYTLVDAYGVKVLVIAPVLLDWSTTVSRTVMMLPHMAKQPKRLASHAWLLANGMIGWFVVAAGLHFGFVCAARWRPSQSSRACPRNVDAACHTGRAIYLARTCWLGQTSRMLFYCLGCCHVGG